jgi:hypothetical protein
MALRAKPTAAKPQTFSLHLIIGEDDLRRMRPALKMAPELQKLRA